VDLPPPYLTDGLRQQPDHAGHVLDLNVGGRGQDGRSLAARPAAALPGSLDFAGLRRVMKQADPLPRPGPPAAGGAVPFSYLALLFVAHGLLPLRVYLGRKIANSGKASVASLGGTVSPLPMNS